jgi:sec-independent protein translocase protein TatA
MAIQGLEWVVIAIVVIVLFLWGPERLPKIAKAFGQAKREFEKASKEGGSEEAKTSKQVDVGELSDQKLLEVARTLGIETEGKSREALIREIREKLASAA